MKEEPLAIFDDSMITVNASRKDLLEDLTLSSSLKIDLKDESGRPTGKKICIKFNHPAPVQHSMTIYPQNEGNTLQDDWDMVEYILTLEAGNRLNREGYLFERLSPFNLVLNLTD